jgi:hypothetical protein
MWAARGVLLGTSIAIRAVGCEVPNVIFASTDGASDASAADHASMGEGGLACSDAAPPDATTCCGAVPCIGCGDDDCAKCEAQCSATQLCCVRSQSITCHEMGSCP